MTMEATSKERTSIGIRATALILKDIAGQLPAAHALSECDTVAQLWGIGKTRAVKVGKAGRQFSEHGNSSAASADVVHDSTEFIAACYGYEEAAIMSDVRFKLWKVKTAKAYIVSAPTLMYLPQRMLLLFVWNTLTVSPTVSITIPLRHDPLSVDVAGL